MYLLCSIDLLENFLQDKKLCAVKSCVTNTRSDSQRLIIILFLCVNKISLSGKQPCQAAAGQYKIIIQSNTQVALLQFYGDSPHPEGLEGLVLSTLWRGQTTHRCHSCNEDDVYRDAASLWRSKIMWVACRSLGTK